MAGETQLIPRSAFLADGQGTLKRGTLLGQVSTSGKLVISTKAVSDGSQKRFAVLYDDYDTRAGDVLGRVLREGRVQRQRRDLWARAERR